MSVIIVTGAQREVLPYLDLLNLEQNIEAEKLDNQEPGMKIKVVGDIDGVLVVEMTSRGWSIDDLRSYGSWDT